MELKTAPQALTQPVLAESGIALQVPSFDSKETYELRFREQGRKLYTPRDVSLADSLLGLTRRAAELWQQREEGARTERARIMRDLHDDVASRLLTLMHRSKDAAQYQQASEALSALRETIYALDDQNPLQLTDMLSDLEAQLRERARNHGIEVSWQGFEDLPDMSIPARTRINLTRALAEAASNAIRHGTPNQFKVNLWVESQTLHLSFCNNGARGEPGDWVAGKGLNNILNRMHEIGGEASWNVTGKEGDAGRSCCVELTLPLDPHSQVRPG